MERNTMANGTTDRKAQEKGTCAECGAAIIRGASREYVGGQAWQYSRCVADPSHDIGED